MGKPKQTPKPKKKGGNKSLGPQSENDFLEAADEYEKGGGKWKAGDAVKATRFYMRAIQTYTAGLQKHPKSFDLAYNKAHLQYEICQDARIASHVGPRLEVLKETLIAHRCASELNEENADILFNTAHVLISIAEEIEDSEKDQAVQAFQEALELLGTCLSRQEMEYHERESQKAEAQLQLENANASASLPDGGGEDSMETISISSEPPVQWVNVEEPITGATMLETVLAQLACLGSLIYHVAPAERRALASLSDMATPLIHTKMPYYISIIPTMAVEEPSSSLPFLSITSSTSATLSSSSTPKPLNPQLEATHGCRLAIANFRAGAADAEFRSHLSSVESYAASIRAAFDPLIQEARALNAQRTSAQKTIYEVNVAAAYADALDDFAATTIENEGGDAAPATATAMQVSAEMLDSVIPRNAVPENWTSNDDPMLPFLKKARILSLRGDTEWRKYFGQLLPQPGSGELTGAQVFYRESSACAEYAIQTGEVSGWGLDWEEATDIVEANAIKSLVVQEISSGASSSRFWETVHDMRWRAGRLRGELVREVINELVDRGLTGRQTVAVLLD